MCYPCDSCGRCGKFNPDSPLYVPPPTIPCLKCGGVIDGSTGKCADCGDQAFTPVGDGANALRPKHLEYEWTESAFRRSR